MRKGWRWALGLLSMAASPALAQYSVLSVTGSFAGDVPTHLIVAGAPNELGNGLFQSATTRAYYLSGHFPGRQVLVLIPDEPFSNMDASVRQKVQPKFLVEGGREKEWIKNSGLKVVASSRNRLSGAEFLAFALQFRQIKSLEIFAHASWVAGAALGTKNMPDRFPFTYPMHEAYRPGAPVDLRYFQPGIERLGANFADDGFVALWGCNTGWTIAPMLSKIWKVPALGALTFADFEALHKDGNFYMRSYGHPTGEAWGAWPWASTNESAFPGQKIDCGKACLRMKPNNFPYQGTWGNYNKVKDPDGRVFEGGGLGFMKAFCNFNEGRRVSRVGMRNVREGADVACYRSLGHFMAGSVAPVPVKDMSFVAYKHKIFDLLCPNDIRDGKYMECIQKLEDSEFLPIKGYTSFKGNSVECSTAGCSAQFFWREGVPGGAKTAYGIDQSSVRLFAPRVKPSEALTQLREYHLYLKAWGVYTGKAVPLIRLFARTVPADPAATPPVAIPVAEPVASDRGPAQIEASTAPVPNERIDDNVSLESVPLKPVGPEKWAN